MSVVARMKVNEVHLLGWATRVKLQAVYTADESDPHYEEIKSFFEATPQGIFEAVINNDRAAEQFQPGDHFYVSLERIPRPEPAA
jgi:hypothetical protein